jgi:four helix bundle protein
VERTDARLKAQGSGLKTQAGSRLKAQDASRLKTEFGAIVELRGRMSKCYEQDFRERAFRFACTLFDFCEELARNPGPRRRLSNQLFDAGSSIGANLAESKAAYSRRELASKNAIALKESRETKYWLRIASAKSLGQRNLREWLLQEADEFVAMLTVSVRNLQDQNNPPDEREP